MSSMKRASFVGTKFTCMAKFVLMTAASTSSRVRGFDFSLDGDSRMERDWVYPLHPRRSRMRPPMRGMAIMMRRRSERGRRRVNFAPRKAPRESPASV